jgi:hypothetical protein
MRGIEMAKRIYVVESIVPAHGGTLPITKLVNATNISQAIRHVASKTMSARVASQGDLVKLLKTLAVEEVEEEVQSDNVKE